jgi:quercetin dioxygenase-like cupin family protein
MNPPLIKIGCVANVWTRLMHFEKTGDTELGHIHPHDHVTLLSAGSLAVTVNGKTTNFSAPHIIFISAEQRHELVALEDNTIASCIHAIRSGDAVEDIIDPESVPDGVDPMQHGKRFTGPNPGWKTTLTPN